MLTSEVKGQLAKLLATENLIVEHRNVETACFDVDKRILTLPIWNASDRVYNLLVGHEVGHALFTPVVDFNAEAPKSYVNVTEDARVEKLMKRKFPGLAKDFYHGYKQMNESDFFGINNVEIEKLKLIDRINLHFKLGSERMMPFQNDDEIALREMVGAAETFQQAVDAALAIFKYEKEQQQKEQEEQPTNQQGNTTDEQINPNQGSSTSGDSYDGDSEEQSSSSQSSSDEGQQQQSGEGGANDWEAMTDKMLQENLDNLADKSEYSNPLYIEVPKVDLDHIIISPKMVWDMASTYWNDDAIKSVADFTRADTEYRQFKSECSREVSFLAKEFEMKKAASSFARESVSRTGVLDTSKLHTYLYNEDLFKKITVRPDGKNHGLIFMLDWSGSMCESIHATYKQLLSLCLFCRKVGIPFDVYAFVNDATFTGTKSFNYNRFKENDFCVPEHFQLLNLLSSKLNNSVFDTYAKYLWRVTIMYASRYTDMMRRDWQLTASIPDCIPPCLYLGGTPLNEAVVCLKTLIPAFRQKNNVEKVHVSLLTDGEACWSQRWVNPKQSDANILWRRAIGGNLIIRNPKNGRTHNCLDSNRLTQTLLQYLKAEFPECNFLGFRIASTRDVNYYIDASDLNSQTNEKLKKEWSKNKSCCAPILGFQEIYFIAQKSLETSTEFEVSEDATKAQIKNAFQKSLKSKANNKKILSSFISQIA